MKKIIRLTESDLARIVKRVLKEAESPEGYGTRVINPFIEKNYTAPQAIENSRITGFKKTNKINLPDGDYQLKSGDGLYFLHDKKGSFTGYIVSGPKSESAKGTIEVNDYPSMKVIGGQVDGFANQPIYYAENKGSEYSQQMKKTQPKNTGF